jgi:predicted  nucleic acid-binding Zn-ribbon protein
MQNLPLLLEPVDEEKKMKENSNDLNNNLLNFKEKREELEVDITSLGKKIERKTNKNKPARESIVEYIKKE